MTKLTSTHAPLWEMIGKLEAFIILGNIWELEKEKDYVILDCDNNEEEDDANEESKNKLKVINNKISVVQQQFR